MFFGRDQADIDAAFLTYTRRFNLSKVRKMLAKGANPLVKDAEGNTALHKLMETDTLHSLHQNEMDEFVCFLLEKKIDINARNNQGKTCLHLAASAPQDYNRVRPGVLINRGADPNIPDNEGKTFLHYAAMRFGTVRLNEFIKEGARINVKDNEGRTPLHIAASHGNEEAVNACLTADISLIAVQDKAGRFPHESAIAVAPGHYALSRQLLDRLNTYNARLKAEAERKAQAEKDKTQVKISPPPIIKPPAPVSTDNWVLLKPDQAAHVSIEKSIGYKFTEIFNFHARVYTRIVHHLETRTEGVETKSFDDFPDKTLFVDACRELKRLGGKADEDAIYGRVLDKTKPKSSAPRLQDNG